MRKNPNSIYILRLHIFREMIFVGLHIIRESFGVMLLTTAGAVCYVSFEFCEIGLETSSEYDFSLVRCNVMFGSAFGSLLYCFGISFPGIYKKTMLYGFLTELIFFADFYAFDICLFSVFVSASTMTFLKSTSASQPGN